MKNKLLIILLLITLPALCGCIDLDIPTTFKCTSDGVRYDPVTLEIIDDPNTGAAITCNAS